MYLGHQEGNATANNEFVKKLLETGQSWSDMWLEFGKRMYPYDENFMSVSHYVKENSISEPFTKKLTRNK